ncbi:hypothetical protein [Neisseria canis]|uniref:Uncharacterized protein n=1 Tax=Neisseria canis TaxID=493 RepID=A0A1X3CWC9_9NEIS|nr:hypothetical protein [Neisseria canis]OSI11784.1 hypothetical protein BWD07_08760 [Neisseria canis]VEF02308.1 Uncharacterised protein [Neisseria canis]
MVSKYDSIDEEFVKNVCQQLWDRTYMNINDTRGVMYMTTNDRQEIFPQVQITHEDIRQETKRRAIRGTVLNKFHDMFEEKGFEVTRTETELIIKVPEIREKGVTEFTNFRSLRDANTRRMSEYNSSRDEYETQEDFEADNPTNFPF